MCQVRAQCAPPPFSANKFLYSCTLCLINCVFFQQLWDLYPLVINWNGISDICGWCSSLVLSSSWQTSSVWGSAGQAPWTVLLAFWMVSHIHWVWPLFLGTASLAVGLREQAGGEGGHLLSALMFSTSFCKCVGDLNCSDGHAVRLVKHLMVVEPFFLILSYQLHTPL